MDFVNKSLVNILFLSCGFVNRLNDVYTYLHIKNKSFRDLIWYTKTAYYTITFQHTEPYKCPWISKSWLTPDMTSITDRYIFHEQYKTNFDEVFVSLSNVLYDTMNASFKMFCHDTMSVDSSLFIMKLLNEDKDDMYIVSINEPQMPTTIKKSPAKFLCITYKHPEMEKSIEINIDKSWFYAGNVLLSSTFVLRALKYQSQQFFFDMNYTICIMDNDINIITLGSEKHILLTEDGYEVIGEEVVEDELVEEEIVEDEVVEDELVEEEIEESDSETQWNKTYELCGQFLNDIS
jgi:hypothetical protein